MSLLKNIRKEIEIVYWQYQTMIFEFQKDGLLGDKYIDDEEVENLLNEQGREGWELVNVTPVQDGLMAFFKKEAGPVARQIRVQALESKVDGDQIEKEKQQVREQVPVRDGELVGRTEKKQRKSPPGENDLIGGIKIS